MSRTDVHRPYWVMMLDPTIRHWFADFHDHRTGTCDLDVKAQAHEYWYERHCHRQLWTQAPNLCSCDMCGGGFWRRQYRRKVRHTWTATRRRLLQCQDWQERYAYDSRYEPLAAKARRYY